jgi:hypothetical protein
MVRVRRRRVLFVSLGATALVMSTALGVAASAPTTTSSVLKAAKAAISKQTGVHVVESFKSGSTSGLMIADLGTKSGEETLEDTFSEGKAIVSYKLTPTHAYISGNSSGLTTISAFTAAQAKKAGKDWISVKAGTSAYATAKSGVTISSQAVLLPAANGTTLSTAVTDGVHLYVLKWTTAATSSMPKVSNTMTISAVGATLPVELIMTTASSGSSTTKFSKWGEQVAVSAPPVASTISFSKVTS